MQWGLLVEGFCGGIYVILLLADIWGEIIVNNRRLNVGIGKWVIAAFCIVCIIVIASRFRK